MAGSRKFMTWAMVAGIVIVLAAGGYLLFWLFTWQSVPIMHAVPAETVVLTRPVEMKKQALTARVNRNILDKLVQIPLTSSATRALLKMDSILGNESNMRELILKNEFLIAWVPSPDTILHPLVLIELQDILEARQMNAFVNRHFVIAPQATEFKGTEIKRIEGTAPFFFAISQGIFAGSTALDILKEAIDRKTADQVAFQEEAFAGIISTSGKNVDANIFVYIPRLLKAIQSEETALLAYLGEYASLDLMVKENGIMLNGFLNSGKEANGFRDLFIRSEAAPTVCPAILPASASDFVKLAFTDFDSLCCTLARLRKSVTGFEPALPVSDFEKKHFVDWAGSEAVFSRTAPRHQIAALMVREDSRPLDNLQGITSDEPPENFSGIEIKKLYREGLIRDLFWPFSGEMALPYYCQCDRYIVFGDSPDALRQMIRNYTIGRTLAGSSTYELVSAGITEYSSLHYFANLERLLAAAQTRDEDRLTDGFISPTEAHRHFSSVTGQFTLSGEWIYASIFMAYTDIVPEEGPYLWKCPLNGHVRNGPFLLADEEEQTTYIVATDTNNRLYLVSSSGKLLWEREISGPVMGGVSFFHTKDGKKRILLNTASQLVVFTMEGDYEDGYPVPLEVGAACGHKLVHYDDVGEMRILLPGLDGRIYNYDVDGKKVSGWKEPDLPATPLTTPQHLVVAKKDYLVFADTEGNVLITDRQGKERVRYKGGFTNGANSGFSINRTNSRGLFITTDDNGHLVYVPEKGRIEKTVFGEFSSGHFFIYQDITGDNHEDFVYFDRLKMQAFDRFKKKLSDVDLPEAPVSKPLSIPMESKQNSFFFQGLSGQVYRVDPNGIIQSDEELITDSQFIAWRNNNINLACVIVTGKNHLYCYAIY